jgi:hypothetical protein
MLVMQGKSLTITKQGVNSPQIMALCKLKKQDTFQNALDKYNKT